MSHWQLLFAGRSGYRAPMWLLGSAPASRFLRRASQLLRLLQFWSALPDSIGARHWPNNVRRERIEACGLQSASRCSNGCTRKELSMIVGSGHFKYRAIADWAKLPKGWSFKE